MAETIGVFLVDHPKRGDHRIIFFFVEMDLFPFYGRWVIGDNYFINLCESVTKQEEERF